MRVGDNLEAIGASHDHQVGVLLTLYATTPLRIVRFGANVISDAWDTDAAVITMKRSTHNAAGTATAAAVGGVTCVPTDANEGTVFYADPTDEVIVKPGDYVTVELTAAGTSGDLMGWIQYQKLNWDDTGPNANFSDATPTSRMVNGTT
jgi:hypothetical protein